MFIGLESHVLGLSRNLFCTLWNVPTVVGIACRGNGYECRIYGRSIVINLRIDTKDFYREGGRCKGM